MSLPYGATLTIGGTVNLGNYENLKVELTGSVRDQAEADGLIDAFGEVLGRMGRDDLEIGARVDAFRHRVLGGGPLAAAAPAAEPVRMTEIREPAPAPAPTRASVPIAEPAPVTKPAETPATAPPKAVPKAAPKAEPKPEPKPDPKPAKKPAPTTSPTVAGEVCADCGGPVTGSERKTSMLFVSKVLCKKCIQKIDDDGVSS